MLQFRSHGKDYLLLLAKGWGLGLLGFRAANSDVFIMLFVSG
jgi:hypothetical protein